MGKIFEVRPGIEVVGAPWKSKRPLTDLVSTAADALEATVGVIRIMVGHGAVDQLSPDKDNPAFIRVADAEKALSEGRYRPKGNHPEFIPRAPHPGLAGYGDFCAPGR